MLLIQSLIVYSLFAFLLYINAVNVRRIVPNGYSYSNGHSLPKGYWICIFIFALISGIRWNVGVDYLSYYYDYSRMLDGTFEARSRGIEIGYLVISQAFSKLKIHFVFYFAFLAFIQIYFILLAFRNHRHVVPFMLLVLVLGGYYFSIMNGIRQQIVACSFLWAINFAIEKKPVKYIIWVACAYLMHHSVLILLPVFLLVYDNRIWNKKWANLIIFIICIILGNTPSWINSLTRLEGLLTFLGYDNYLENLTEISSFRTFNFGPRMIVMMGTYILTLWFYPKASKYFKDQKFDWCFKLYFIGLCGYYLFINSSALFLRPIEYFTLFGLPVIAYILVYLRKEKGLPYMLLLLFSLSFTFLSCFADYKAPELDRRMQLYQFFFSQT